MTDILLYLIFCSICLLGVELSQIKNILKDKLK
jgi:hypothetical protein